MRFSGNLTYSTPDIHSSVINTPGSENANNNGINLDRPQRYPIYNEALGIFALLKKPKIEISRMNSAYVQKVKEYIFHFQGDPHHYPIYKTVIKEDIQFKLQEELEYNFNPALSIKEFSIDASILIKPKLEKGSSGGYEVNQVNVNDYTEYYSYSNNHANIESTSFNLSNDEGLEFDEELSVNSPFLPLNSIFPMTSGFGLKKVFNHPDNFCETINWHGSCGISPTYEDESFNDGMNPPYHLVVFGQNNFEPINRSEYFAYMGSTFISQDENTIINDFNNNGPHAEINDIYLKLIINVTYEGEKSDGSPHEYTYMFTYKVDESDITWEYDNPLYPNLPGSAGDITQYPENILLNGEVFDGSPVEGCQLSGNTYLCKAWNDIELSGEFTVANNFEVIVEAGEQVVVLPESVTPPEMTWQIVPVLDFSNPMPPVDETYVSTFCNDNNAYQARVSNFPIADNDSVEVIEEHINDNFAFTIFPNPTGGSATAVITLNEVAKGELFITDMNGKKLGVVLENQLLRDGENNYSLPTENLASGIYLVHLFVNGEHHVKRLVKQ